MRDRFVLVFLLFVLAISKASGSSVVTTYTLPNAGGTAQWALIGTFTAGQQGNTVMITAYIHAGFNANVDQDSTYVITFNTSNGSSVDGNGFAGDGSWYNVGFNSSVAPGGIVWVANAAGTSATAFGLYIYLPVFTWNSQYTVSVDSGSGAAWTNVGTLQGQTSPDPGQLGSSTVMIPPDGFNIPYGNVGIGTTGPNAALTIMSSGNWNNSWSQKNGFQVLSGTTSGTDYTLYMGVDTTNKLSYIQSVGIGVGGSPLALNARGGNVGIGTTNPLSLLSVGSSSQFQVDSSGNVTTTGTFTGSGSGLINIPYTALAGAPASTVTSFSGRTGAVTPTSNDYSVSQINGAAPLASPAFTGNVGIGVIAPLTPLQVGNNYSGIGESTYKGLIMVQGSADLNSGVNGLEFKASPSESGYGWKVLSADRSNGNTPLSFAYRKNNSVWTELVTMRADTGSVGIGTTAPNANLEVNGTAQVDGTLTLGSGSGGIVFPNGGGTQAVAYNGVTCGGDYAESVDVSGDRTHYGPGDVIVIDPNNPGRFLKSAEPYSTSVTGVYSTKPGTLGRRQTTPKSPDEVPMAMIGIVPTKVSAENGAIHTGDLLVTSSSIGYAMKGTDRSRMLGAVIGKALGNLDGGKGVIEVVVTLQ